MIWLNGKLALQPKIRLPLEGEFPNKPRKPKMLFKNVLAALRTRVRGFALTA